MRQPHRRAAYPATAAPAAGTGQVHRLAAAEQGLHVLQRPNALCVQRPDWPAKTPDAVLQACPAGVVSGIGDECPRILGSEHKPPEGTGANARFAGPGQGHADTVCTAQVLYRRVSGDGRSGAKLKREKEQ